MGGCQPEAEKTVLYSTGAMGDIMSQLDETLGGLRVIKAFIAESKMSARFSKTNNDFRDAMNEMIIRQSSATP